MSTKKSSYQIIRQQYQNSLSEKAHLVQELDTAQINLAQVKDELSREQNHHRLERKAHNDTMQRHGHEREQWAKQQAQLVTDYKNAEEQANKQAAEHTQLTEKHHALGKDNVQLNIAYVKLQNQYHTMCDSRDMYRGFATLFCVMFLVSLVFNTKALQGIIV